MELTLAVDLTGSPNGLGLVDRDGKVLDSLPLAPTEALDGLWEELEGVLEQVPARVARNGGTLSACGVAVGATVGDLAGASGRDLLAEASRLVSSVVEVPVHVEDGGRAFALAEGWLGAAREVENFAALTIDETVSGGVVVDGRLLDGAMSQAGRIGHWIVEPEGRRCPCGARGCLESEVSVPAIELSSGRPLTEPSYEQMRHVGRMVGRAAASIVNLLDVRLVVCGGRVAREYASTMILAAQEELDATCRISFSRGARIVTAKTPAPSGLIGAAAVAWNRTGGVL